MMNRRTLLKSITLSLAVFIGFTAFAKPGVFDPEDAELSGSVKINKGRIGYWKKNSSATYDLKKVKAGKYHVSISYAVDAKSGGLVSILLDGKTAGKFKVSSTGGWDKYKVITVGPLNIGKDHSTLTITGVPDSQYLMNMGKVTLKKTK
ncbi:carbohydrate-binding protein [Pelagicoccus enzymogenes]|uniref:carbohydrate-binding protein n=1 Tax=Pelagicoccus enzymogenes TaxID=2773457 RepID=UPI00280D807C|nr:carbohydrate-binding protein [Pelagicoccus enzymogenes]MDQ8198253.1 carbohydrate-binding protein [Pelagicoccus enzymogenes]